VSALTVDIIINNHNYGRFLADAIESGLGQSYQPCVVTVVDDGSTDDSAEILARYLNRVQVLSQAQSGQAAAVNSGFDASSGDIVLFLDADDLLDQDVVANVVTAFQDHHDVAKVQFPLRHIDRDGRPLPGFIPAKPGQMPQGDVREALLRYNDDLAWSSMSGNAYPRAILTKIMPIPTTDYPKIGADIYLINLAPLYGPVVSLERPGGSYRIHGQNADYRSDFDLQRASRIVALSHVTHDHIERHAHLLGLSLPAEGVGSGSITLIAQEMTLARIGAARPFDVARSGMSVLKRRRDLMLRSRLLFAGWLIAMTILPRSMARALAGVTLRPGGITSRRNP
jgi:glycosyl transferase family 2